MPIQPISHKAEYAISDTKLRQLIAEAIGYPLEELEITFTPTTAINNMSGIANGISVKVVHDRLKNTLATVKTTQRVAGSTHG